VETLVDELSGWLQPVLLSLAVTLLALGLHRLVVSGLRELGERLRSTTGAMVVQHLAGPSRWLLVAFFLTAIQPALALPDQGVEAWMLVTGMILPALFGWLAIALVGLMTEIIMQRADITVEDNLRARRRRTRAAILRRIAYVVIVVITACMMLVSIPGVRAVGVALVASSGLVALALGAAAQPALRNLIAGVQMAFTEPIRLDDVVIIDGEWGRIEEIRLTFVVVRIWDDRRLVVPVAKFLEHSFQNWTRQSSQLLGSVFWHVDPATDVARMREKLAEIVEANPRWDRRFFNLQVTDTKIDAIEVRALVTAKDASTAFDLRCDVREAMLDFIRREMPEAIVRRRAEVELDGRRVPHDAVIPQGETTFL
jgi:small-conductance mechanosensitive channel